MDVYRILVTHNRSWSIREMICFGMVLAAAALFLWRAVKRGRMKASQAASSFLLLIFLGIVFASTVFTRAAGTRHYELIPFWSWMEVLFCGNRNLLQENLLNCLLLVPMGMMLPVIAARPVGMKEAFLAGTAVSAVIEICQLIFCRGLFEWDDMVHNGLGCMFGSMAACWVIAKVKKSQGRNGNSA